MHWAAGRVSVCAKVTPSSDHQSSPHLRQRSRFTSLLQRVVVHELALGVLVAVLLQHARQLTLGQIRFGHELLDHHHNKYSGD